MLLHCSESAASPIAKIMASINLSTTGTKHLESKHYHKYLLVASRHQHVQAAAIFADLLVSSTALQIYWGFNTKAVAQVYFPYPKQCQDQAVRLACTSLIPNMGASQQVFLKLSDSLRVIFLLQ